MTDRIQTLVKRISDTRPVQSARRQALLDELRQLRRDLDHHSAPDQVHSLDAALLLLEFMSRSEDVATAETLSIVAGLVGTIDERLLRKLPKRAEKPAEPAHQDVTQHKDLRLTQEFLLGTVLVQAKVVSQDSLARALQLHTSSGIPLGQCLVQLGAATPEQIAEAVACQDRLRGESHPPAMPGRATPAHSTGDLRLSAKQEFFVQSFDAQVLGEVLIRLGAITREQLEHALQVKRAAGVHIGQALVETGATTWEHVKRALEVQRQLRKSVTWRGAA